MIINGKNYDLSQIISALKKEELNIDSADSALQTLFSVFDVNQDNILEESEIKNIFDIFAQADYEEESSGVLTNDEMDSTVDIFRTFVKNSTKQIENIKNIDKTALLKFFNIVSEANTDNLVNNVVEIKNIEEHKLNSPSGTIEVVGSKLNINIKNADFINKDNVLDFISAYYDKTKSVIGFPSLKYNETFFENIDMFKKYICKPLAEKAAEFGIVFDYENIDDITSLSVEIPKIVREINKGISDSYSVEVLEKENNTKTIEKLKTSSGFNITTTLKDEHGNLQSELISDVSESDSGVVTVASTRRSYHGSKVKEAVITYQYSKEGIEDYIIGNSRNNMYADIKNIRERQANGEITEEESALLEQFDKMVESIINAGNEYGVDPNLVASIIRQETFFDGMNDAWCTGVNGKGYMQLTTAPVADYLGKYLDDDKYSYSINNKDEGYGWELKELFESRGFDIENAKGVMQKDQLVRNIMAYLKENDDAEFNIRLGTLVLRHYQNRKGGVNGDIGKAAFHYNGNPALQGKYAKNVRKFYAELRDTIPTTERVDTTYSYKTRLLDV